MKTSNYIKAWVIVIILFSLSLFVATKLEGQATLSPAPTIQNCNCIVAKGFKQTEDNLSSGTVTVYSNQVTFKFNSTVKTFHKHTDEVWVDDKENIWLLIETQNGDKIFKNKKVLYFYNEKIQ